MKRAFSFVIFVLTLSGNNVHAIDCSKAQKNLEKKVCSHPDLMKLDKELNQEYSKLAARLSGQGKKELRDSQREWIAFINDALCFKDFYPTCKHNKDPYNKTGIAEAYVARIKFLKVFPELEKSKLVSFAKIWTYTAGSLNNQTFYIPFMNRYSTHESGLQECFKENGYMKSNQEEFQSLLSLTSRGKHIVSEGSQHLCFTSEMEMRKAGGKNKQDLLYKMSCIEKNSLAEETDFIRDVSKLDKKQITQIMQKHSQKILDEIRAEIHDSESDITLFERYKS